MSHPRNSDFEILPESLYEWPAEDLSENSIRRSLPARIIPLKDLLTGKFRSGDPQNSIRSIPKKYLVPTAESCECNACGAPIAQCEGVILRQCKTHKICKKCVVQTVAHSRIKKCPVKSCDKLFRPEEIKATKLLQFYTEPWQMEVTSATYISLLDLNDDPLWPTLRPVNCANCRRPIKFMKGIVLQDCLQHSICRACIGLAISASRFRCPYEDCPAEIRPTEIEEFCRQTLMKEGLKMDREKFSKFRELANLSLTEYGLSLRDRKIGALSGVIEEELQEEDSIEENGVTAEKARRIDGMDGSFMIDSSDLKRAAKGRSSNGEGNPARKMLHRKIGISVRHIPYRLESRGSI